VQQSQNVPQQSIVSSNQQLLLLQQQQQQQQQQNDCIINGNQNNGGEQNGPKLVLRDNLHYAADSVSNAMSSLVKELHSGAF
jgi:hypothetical protein